MSIEQELKEIIIRDLGIQDLALEEFSDDLPLFGEGVGLDSLDAVELVVMLKKRYGVDAELLEKQQDVMASVRTLAEFVRAQKGEP